MSTALESYAREDIKNAIRLYCGGLTPAARQEIEDALTAELVRLERKYRELTTTHEVESL